MGIKIGSFTANNFITFAQGLLSVLQNQNLNNYNFRLYCIDIKDVKINNNGRKNLQTQFNPVKDEKGVYIFFDKRNLQTLYVGAAGFTNDHSSTFYTTPVKAAGGQNKTGSGRVPQHLSGNKITSPIIKYFYATNSNATQKNYIKYINNYSILFICMSTINNNNNNFASDLAALESALIKYLQPLAQ